MNEVNEASPAEGDVERVVMLPCPFCGGKPELIIIGNNHTKKRSATVKCTKCRVQRTDRAMRFKMEWLIEAAIDQWNKRAT